MKNTYMSKMLFFLTLFLLLSSIVYAGSGDKVTVIGGTSSAEAANGDYFYAGTTIVEGVERAYYDKPNSFFRIEFRYNASYDLNEWEVWESTVLGGTGTVRFFNESQSQNIPEGAWIVDVGGGGIPYVTFTPAPVANLSTLSTTAATSVATTSATLGGNVTSDGGATVTDRGVVYSLSSVNSNPQIGGTGVTKVQIGSGTGSFSQSVGSLTQGSSYHFNTYAINSAGTSYGSVSSFTTLAPVINLTGNSITIVNGDLTPSTADGSDFGSVAAASGTVNRSFVIQNTGNSVLSLSGAPPYVSITGAHAADFSVSSVPSNSVSAGGQTTLQITFNPSALGVRTATVSIASDDITKTPYTFAIQGTGLNSAPTDITLSATSIDENVAANSVVGTFTTTDPDAGDTFTYSLVSGDGSSDNGSFNIAGGNLRISNSPDYEAKSSYSIRVRTTDTGDLWFEKEFVISINNLNDNTPVVTPETFSLDEKSENGTVVGTVDATDADGTLNELVFSTKAGNTNNAFAIDSQTGELTVNNSEALDFEITPTFTLTISVSDGLHEGEADIVINLNKVIGTNVIVNTDSKVVIYPNPFTDFIVIEGVDGMAMVSVVDVMGNTVAQTEIYNRGLVSTVHLRSGVYFVIIENAMGVQENLKMIKK